MDYSAGIDVFAPKHFSVLTEEELKREVIKPALVQFLSNADTLVIINDHHRSTPSKVILKILLSHSELRVAAIAIACGTHAPPNEVEIHKLVPEEAEHLPLFIHNAHKDDSFYKYVGETRLGTPVLINPLLYNFEQILCINSVEPHYFAGYTGGVKSIIPGFAALQTVSKNHSWALDPRSAPTVTLGNPVYDDLLEAFKLTNISAKGLQVVSSTLGVKGVFFDELIESQRQAIGSVEEIYVHKVKERYDMIIAKVEPPLDRSLYQAQKGLENTRHALKDGGIIVLVAKCTGGIGNEAFYKTISTYSHPNDVLQTLRRETYNFGDHKASKFASLSLESNLFICSSLSDEVVREVFAEPLNIEELNKMVQQFINERKKIAICEDAGMVVLTIDNFS